ncbi:hypothetical protein PSPO01_13926 [Paraphaeosphaeria sporulosa]
MDRPRLARVLQRCSGERCGKELETGRRRELLYGLWGGRLRVLVELFLQLLICAADTDLLEGIFRNNGRPESMLVRSLKSAVVARADRVDSGHGAPRSQVSAGLRRGSADRLVLGSRRRGPLHSNSRQSALRWLAGQTFLAWDAVRRAPRRETQTAAIPPSRYAPPGPPCPTAPKATCTTSTARWRSLAGARDRIPRRLLLPDPAPMAGSKEASPRWQSHAHPPSALQCTTAVRAIHNEESAPKLVRLVLEAWEREGNSRDDCIRNGWEVRIVGNARAADVKQAEEGCCLQRWSAPRMELGPYTCKRSLGQGWTRGEPGWDGVRKDGGTQTLGMQ